MWFLLLNIEGILLLQTRPSKKPKGVERPAPEGGFVVPILLITKPLHEYGGPSGALPKERAWMASRAR
jgi:hypothetical protein